MCGPASQAAALSLQLSADTTDGGGHCGVERLGPPLGIRTQRIHLASSRSPLLPLRVCNCCCSLAMSAVVSDGKTARHVAATWKCNGKFAQVPRCADGTYLRLCVDLLPQLLCRLSSGLCCCPCLLCLLSTALRLQTLQRLGWKGNW
jgi:hypothetical protein